MTSATVLRLYMRDEKHDQSKVRRHYLRWRAAAGVAYRCDLEGCLLGVEFPAWMGQPLTLILDHVDGNKRNNEPGNLRFLCPNCNAQQPTHGGGNARRVTDFDDHSYLVRKHNGTRHYKHWMSGGLGIGGGGESRIIRAPANGDESGGDDVHSRV